jgi:hypothetical protein
MATQNVHNEIEVVLNAFKKAIRDFSGDAERLSEEGLISEPNDPLYNHINELYKLQINLNQLITQVLADDYEPKKTKKLLAQTHTLRVLQDSTNGNSPIANLLRMMESTD